MTQSLSSKLLVPTLIIAIGKRMKTVAITSGKGKGDRESTQSGQSLHFTPSPSAFPSSEKTSEGTLNSAFLLCSVKAASYWRERQKRCRDEGWGHRIKSPASLSSVPVRTKSGSEVV